MTENEDDFCRTGQVSDLAAVVVVVVGIIIIIRGAREGDCSVIAAV